jgi:hypothetical protein
MKSTERLSVMGDFTLSRDLILIHPNDGYDLGLLARETPVLIYACESAEEFLSGTARSIPGTLVLENSCTLSTVIMNLAWWHELGKPREVTLGYEGEKLLITRA